MKITFDQSEIELAIMRHVNATISLSPGTVVEVELFTLRGSKEINASIELTSAEDAAAAKVEPAVVVVVEPTATTVEAAPEAAAVEAEDAPEHVEQPKSLFGNLNRPKNA
jgi:hypothetical protein